LWVACARGHTQIVEYLLEQDGKEELLAMKGVEDTSCVWIACQQNSADALVHVLDAAPALLDTPMADGTSPLLVACGKGHLELVKMLHKRGAALAKARKDGATCLWVAAGKGHLEVCRFLVQEGGKELLYKTRNDGDSCLWVACAMGNLDVVKLLFEAGGEDLLRLRKSGGSTCISIARELQHTAIVDYLVSAGAEPLLGSKEVEPTPPPVGDEENVEASGHAETPVPVAAVKG